MSELINRSIVSDPLNPYFDKDRYYKATSTNHEFIAWDDTIKSNRGVDTTIYVFDFKAYRPDSKTMFRTLNDGTLVCNRCALKIYKSLRAWHTSKCWSDRP